jgi:Fur family transcriptional regulator, ferric uptake regulator
MARPSPVRDALAAVFAAHERHDWSMEDLQAAVRERGLDADFSSVFRAVSRLEADAQIRRVQLGDGKARYEAAGAHHEHVRCDSCGAVGAVPGCVVDAALPRVEALTGFRVTGHQLLFSGTCPDCAGG